MEFSVASFFSAFRSAPRPDFDEITLHRCWECDDIRDQLSNHDVDDVPIDFLDYHGDGLTLLSAKAYRYYLPAYVRHSCDFRDATVTDYVLFSLSPDNPSDEFWADRCDDFTAEEIEAVLAYLRFRRTWDDASVDEKWIGSGIQFWEKRLTCS